MRYSVVFLVLWLALLPERSAGQDGGNITVLSTPARVDLRKGLLFLNGIGLPAAFNERRLLSIDYGFLQDDEPEMLATPAGFEPEAIVCLADGEILTKNGRSIRGLRGGNWREVMHMPDARFSIWPAMEQTVYLVRDDGEKGSDIFLLNSALRQAVKLVSLSSAIDGVAGDGVRTYAWSGTKIYLFTVVGSHEICTADAPVRSLAVCSAGVFYATSSGVYYLAEAGDPLPVYAQGAQKLLGAGEALYVLDDRGTFFVIDRIAQYTQSITN